MVCRGLSGKDELRIRARSSRRPLVAGGGQSARVAAPKRGQPKRPACRCAPASAIFRRLWRQQRFAGRGRPGPPTRLGGAWWPAFAWLGRGRSRAP
nr:hypothetical protein [Tanacetum cinerariifolium]